jgi:AraC-like DNA-binding protein
MTAPDPFPFIQHGDEEIHRTTAYRFENSGREGPASFVIQRTLSGAAFYSDAQGRQLVPAGHAMIFTHHEPTTYGYPPEASEPYRLRFIAFVPAGAQGIFERLRADFGSVVRMPDASEATALLDEVIQRYGHRQFRDRLHESELLFRLLIALYREQVQDTRTTDPIEFGSHYIRSHFRSPVNLKAIVLKCGVSREHFIREFSARYRESPGVMLRRLRLEHARAMLQATELSVQEIALACGFTSSNTFCRAYRLRFGRSPGMGRR